MSGARPLWLSAGFILEEGLPWPTWSGSWLRWPPRPSRAGVQIVTGDTKVVDRGSADKLFINTAGVGLVPPGVEICRRPGPARRRRAPERHHRRPRHDDHDPARGPAVRQPPGERLRAPQRPGGCPAGSGALGSGPLPARSHARRVWRRPSTSWQAAPVPASRSTRRRCRCAMRCAAPASCWAWIPSMWPTRASWWPSSRRRPQNSAGALRAHEYRPGGGHHRPGDGGPSRARGAAHGAGRPPRRRHAGGRATAPHLLEVAAGGRSGALLWLCAASWTIYPQREKPCAEAFPACPKDFFPFD